MYDSTTAYVVSFYYDNSGSDEGSLTRSMGCLYVARPDDRAAQEDLAKTFEGDWKNQPSASSPLVVLRNAPGFWTEHQSISRQNEDDLKAGKATMYFIQRVEYRDQTGKWRSDRCEQFQSTPLHLNINILHLCSVLMNGRYRVGRP